MSSPDPERAAQIQAIRDLVAAQLRTDDDHPRRRPFAEQLARDVWAELIDPVDPLPGRAAELEEARRSLSRPKAPAGRVRDARRLAAEMVDDVLQTRPPVTSPVAQARRDIQRQAMVDLVAGRLLSDGPDRAGRLSHARNLAALLREEAGGGSRPVPAGTRTRARSGASETRRRGDSASIATNRSDTSSITFPPVGGASGGVTFSRESRALADQSVIYSALSPSADDGRPQPFVVFVTLSDDGRPVLGGEALDWADYGNHLLASAGYQQHVAGHPDATVKIVPDRSVPAAVFDTDIRSLGEQLRNGQAFPAIEIAAAAAVDESGRVRMGGEVRQLPVGAAGRSGSGENRTSLPEIPSEGTTFVEDLFDDLDRRLRPDPGLWRTGDTTRATPVTSDEAESVYRIPKEDQRLLQSALDRFGFRLEVRPSEWAAVRWSRRGAVRKPPELRASTIDELDSYLGVPADYQGLVGFFAPVRPARESVPADRWEAVRARYRQRAQEQRDLADSMGELADQGKIRLAGGLVEWRTEDGGFAKVAGAGDPFRLVTADGEPLAPEQDELFRRLIRRRTGIGRPAGFGEETPGPGGLSADDVIVARHKAAEPVLRFQPGRPPVLVRPGADSEPARLLSPQGAGPVETHPPLDPALVGGGASVSRPAAGSLSVDDALRLPPGSVVTGDVFRSDAESEQFFAVHAPWLVGVNADGAVDRCLEMCVQGSFAMKEKQSYRAGPGRPTTVGQANELANALMRRATFEQIFRHMRAQEGGAQGLVYVGGGRRDGHYLLVRKAPVEEGGLITLLDVQAQTMGRTTPRAPVVGFVPLPWTPATELKSRVLDKNLVAGRGDPAAQLANHPVLRRWQAEAGRGPIVTAEVFESDLAAAFENKFVSYAKKMFHKRKDDRKDDRQGIGFHAKDVWSGALMCKGVPVGVTFDFEFFKEDKEWARGADGHVRYTWLARDSQEELPSARSAESRRELGYNGRVEAPGAEDYTRHSAGPIEVSAHAGRAGQVSVWLPPGTRLTNGRTIRNRLKVRLRAPEFAAVLDNSESFRSAYAVRPDGAIRWVVCHAGASGLGVGLVEALTQRGYRNRGYFGDNKVSIAFQGQNVGDVPVHRGGAWVAYSPDKNGVPQREPQEDTVYPEFKRQALIALETWADAVTLQQAHRAARAAFVAHPEYRFGVGVNRPGLDGGKRSHVRNALASVIALSRSIIDGRTVPAEPGGPVTVGEAQAELGAEFVAASLPEITAHMQAQPEGAQGVVFLDGNFLLVHKDLAGKVNYLDALRETMADLEIRLGRADDGTPVEGPSGFAALEHTGARPLDQHPPLDPALVGGASPTASVTSASSENLPRPSTSRSFFRRRSSAVQSLATTSRDPARFESEAAAIFEDYRQASAGLNRLALPEPEVRGWIADAVALGQPGEAERHMLPAGSRERLQVIDDNLSAVHDPAARERIRGLVNDAVLAAMLAPGRVDAAGPGTGRQSIRPIAPDRLTQLLDDIRADLQAGRNPFDRETSMVHGVDWTPGRPLPVRLAVLGTVNLSGEARAGLSSSALFRTLLANPAALAESLFAGAGHEEQHFLGTCVPASINTELRRRVPTLASLLLVGRAVADEVEKATEMLESEARARRDRPLGRTVYELAGRRVAAARAEFEDLEQRAAELASANSRDADAWHGLTDRWARTMQKLGAADPRQERVPVLSPMTVRGHWRVSIALATAKLVDRPARRLSSIDSENYLSLLERQLANEPQGHLLGAEPALSDSSWVPVAPRISTRSAAMALWTRLAAGSGRVLAPPIHTVHVQATRVGGEPAFVVNDPIKATSKTQTPAEFATWAAREKLTAPADLFDEPAGTPESPDVVSYSALLVDGELDLTGVLMRPCVTGDGSRVGTLFPSPEDVRSERADKAVAGFAAGAAPADSYSMLMHSVKDAAGRAAGFTLWQEKPGLPGQYRRVQVGPSGWLRLLSAVAGPENAQRALLVALSCGVAPESGGLLRQLQALVDGAGRGQRVLGPDTRVKIEPGGRVVFDPGGSLREVGADGSTVASAVRLPDSAVSDSLDEGPGLVLEHPVVRSTAAALDRMADEHAMSVPGQELLGPDVLQLRKRKPPMPALRGLNVPRLSARQGAGLLSTMDMLRGAAPTPGETTREALDRAGAGVEVLRAE
ncbi:hypothetical protein ABT261_31515, partial [Amycolatopsis sp. NPDC000740]